MAFFILFTSIRITDLTGFATLRSALAIIGQQSNLRKVHPLTCTFLKTNYSIEQFSATITIAAQIANNFSLLSQLSGLFGNLPVTIVLIWHYLLAAPIAISSSSRARRL